MATWKDHRIQDNKVTVGPNGRVQASIRAREVIILGQVQGNVGDADKWISARKRNWSAISPPRASASKTAPCSRAASISRRRSRSRPRSAASTPITGESGERAVPLGSATRSRRRRSMIHAQRYGDKVTPRLQVMEEPPEHVTRETTLHFRRPVSLFLRQGPPASRRLPVLAVPAAKSKRRNHRSAPFSRQSRGLEQFFFNIRDVVGLSILDLRRRQSGKYRLSDQPRAQGLFAGHHAQYRRLLSAISPSRLTPAALSTS